MAKGRGAQRDRNDPGPPAAAARAAARSRLGVHGFKAYGGILGIDGMAAKELLFEATAFIDEEPYLEAMFDGFATEAAVAELEAEVGRHDPPFYPDEIETLHGKKTAILQRLKDEHAGRSNGHRPAVLRQ
jgi:hypothetical protein